MIANINLKAKNFNVKNLDKIDRKLKQPAKLDKKILEDAKLKVQNNFKGRLKKFAMPGKNDVIHNKKYENILKKKIKGVDFKVYVWETDDKKMVNAFTIPGLKNLKDIPNQTSLLDLLTWISEEENFNQDIASELKRQENTVKIKHKDGKVNISGWNLSSDIIIVFTRPFLDLVSEKEMIAIALHEIGHHAYRNRTLEMRGVINFIAAVHKFIWIILVVFSFTGQQALAGITFLVSLSLSLLTWAFLVYISKGSIRSEFNSDKFAKDSGYGEELANALDKMETFFEELRENQFILVKILSGIKRIMVKILVFLGIFVKTHPETKERIKILKQQFMLIKNSINENKSYILNIPKELKTA